MEVPKLQNLIIDKLKPTFFMLAFYPEYLKKLKLDFEQFLTVYVSSGGNVNDTDSIGNTLLLIAILHNDREVASTLIKSKANPNISGFLGFTPLILASLHNDIEIVLEILCSSLVEVNKRCNCWLLDGYTALHIAILLGHVKVVEELLKHRDIDPNILCGTQWFNGIWSETSELMRNLFPEIQGIYNRNFREVNLRLNIKDDGRNTNNALQIAAYYEYTSIELLLKHSQVDLNKEKEGVIEYFKLSYRNKIDRLKYKYDKDMKVRNFHMDKVKLLLTTICSIILLVLSIIYNNTLFRLIFSATATGCALYIAGYVAFDENYKLYKENKLVLKSIQDECDQGVTKLERLFE